MIFRRRFFAPEVVQTSNMDCGPASLKCLLEGFGIRANYGRLREACQTDVDGTSIDTIEDAARELGLDAEQVMVPLDHIFPGESQLLPAIVVTRHATGVTHFVVLWRKSGPWVQIMDPGEGRHWTTARRFLEDVYHHSMPVPAEDWREWAASEKTQAVLRRRMAKAGIKGEDELRQASQEPGWQRLGAIDAAVRAIQAMLDSGGIRRGDAQRLFGAFVEQPELIPECYWSVLPHSDEEVLMRGAVLVSVRRAIPREQRTAAPASPDLAAALEQPPMRPGLELLKLLRADGYLAPGVLLGSFLFASGGLILEAALFRGLLDLGRELGLGGQRLAAVAMLAGFLLLLLLVDIPLASGLLRMGRHLETRLRQAFLEKVPRLGDRYFQSRLKSDMADRSHSIHRIRNLPELGGQLIRVVMEMLLTVGAIIWLDPAGAALAAAVAVVSVLLPLALQPVIVERDLRVRSHAGGLSRFYLDALLGLVPIRSHGAERAVRMEHGRLLVEWARSAFRLQRAVVGVEAIQFTASYGMAIWLVVSYLTRNAESGGALLLIYWALGLPALAQEIALSAWQYPSYRNTTLRLIEPLGATETAPGSAEPASAMPEGVPPGMDLRFRNVTVRASGHTILEGVNLEISPGSHVAIVGPSGAGKSSLVGILLGWHRPAEGSVEVDGAPLESRLDEIRRQTGWVDPSVQLWNRSLLNNLTYGTTGMPARPLPEVIDAAELRSVLESLPDGLETELGEGGALVSGGEGQRVRFGRALMRPGVRLAILDEAFRGLGIEQRRKLLTRARRLWSGATLLSITHDVGETLGFERVLVIENGRVIEDGVPETLAAQGNSRYRAMIEAERAIRQTFWSGTEWNRLHLEGGRIAI